jgi:hypothetical protein
MKKLFKGHVVKRGGNMVTKLLLSPPLLITCPLKNFSSPLFLSPVHKKNGTRMDLEEREQCLMLK